MDAGGLTELALRVARDLEPLVTEAGDVVGTGAGEAVGAHLARTLWASIKRYIPGTKLPDVSGLSRDELSELIVRLLRDNQDLERTIRELYQPGSVRLKQRGSGNAAFVGTANNSNVDVRGHG